MKLLPETMSFEQWYSFVEKEKPKDVSNEYSKPLWQGSKFLGMTVVGHGLIEYKKIVYEVTQHKHPLGSKFVEIKLNKVLPRPYTKSSSG